MYYINKIVGFLVSPIGGAIAGGVIAVVCARLGILGARLRSVCSLPHGSRTPSRGGYGKASGIGG